MIDVTIIPIFDDNYCYLIETPCGVNAIIDAGQAQPVIEILKQKNARLDFIISTHHHWDHVNGNMELKNMYDAQIIAPAKESLYIDGVDIAIKDGDIFDIGGQIMQAIETVGHTLGSTCFYFKDSGALFTGDTVFSMGCGRIFEGTAADMFASFQKIMALPDETLIYCAHEYTRGNAGFCLSQDRDNDDLKARIKEVKELRSQGKPTLPVLLATEKKTNIFMKVKNAKEFAALRIKKNNF